MVHILESANAIITVYTILYTYARNNLMIYLQLRSFNWRHVRYSLLVKQKIPDFSVGNHMTKYDTQHIKVHVDAIFLE